MALYHTVACSWQYHAYLYTGNAAYIYIERENAGQSPCPAVHSKRLFPVGPSVRIHQELKYNIPPNRDKLWGWRRRWTITLNEKIDQMQNRYFHFHLFSPTVRFSEGKNVGKLISRLIGSLRFTSSGAYTFWILSVIQWRISMYNLLYKVLSRASHRAANTSLISVF